MLTRIIRIALLCAAVAATLGCSRIREVKVSKTGGEIALLGGREGAMEKAKAAMSANCPEGYEIDEQGEVVVGSTTRSRGSERTRKSKSGRKSRTSARSTSSTTDKREWRVVYSCTGAAEPVEKEEEGDDEGDDDSDNEKEGKIQHKLIIRF